jgi:hypothetical protein
MSIRFVLPQPGGAAPAFTTAKACEEWVEALPLTNAASAQGALRAQVDAVTRAGLPLPVLFEILEKLREPLAFVQLEMAKKFTQRPLPMADLEYNAWTGTTGLWRAYGLGYQMCVQGLIDGARDIKGAVACHRALDAQMRVMFDYVRANCQLPGTEWAMLHMLFRAAESLDVLAEKVKDPIQKETPATTCVAAYTQALLTSVGASGEWSGKQLQMIMRWLERWAAKISASHAPPPSPVKPPLMVDLGSLRGGFRGEAGGEVRYLDISEIALSLKNRVILLRKGESPAHLGLGEDCTQPGCEQLLINLYQHWCDGRVARDHARRAGSGSVMIAASLPAAHYYISGKPFKQPGVATELTSKQRAEIATFGRIATRDEDDYSHLHGYSMEQWDLKDESLSGMRISRSREASSARVSPGQLFAVRAPDAKGFMLTAVRWVQMLESGDVMAGLRTIPGAPQPVGVRNTGLNATNEKYQQGFLMPAVESLKSRDSVILPPGTFKPGKVIEVFAETAWKIKLAEMIERGPDFERCSYGGA